MKKLLTFAAIAVVASASYAVQLNWMIGTAMTKDGTPLSGKTVALVMADSASITYDVKTGVSGGSVINVGTLNSDGKFSSPVANPVDGDWGTGAYVGTGLDGKPTSVVSQGTGTSNKQTYYMLIFDNDPLGSGNYAVVTAAAATTVAKATTAAVTTSFSATPANWTAYGTPVPEPCSVALLALGLAAFALKRKVA